MNDRERLVELLDDVLSVYDVIVYALLHTDEIADLLTSHGVTVQKYGRWKFDSDGDPCCSVCRKYAGLLRIESGNYCPHCGAKMDKEEE